MAGRSSSATLSAQLSTVRNAGTPPAFSSRRLSSACGSGTATMGAPASPASRRASTMGRTARSGSNWAEEPMAATTRPVSGSASSAAIVAFMVS